MYIIVHQSVPAGTLVQIALMFPQEHFQPRQPASTGHASPIQRWLFPRCPKPSDIMSCNAGGVRASAPDVPSASLPRGNQTSACEGVAMPITKTDKIWHNGKLIAWDDANLHVMSHVVHYGSSVFEGIRCYEVPAGPAIFRATEHIQRLMDSAKVYRMDVPFTRDEIIKGMLETVGHNGVWPCYVRPVVLRGYGDAGVNPLNNPIEVYIVNYPWGKYLGHESEACDVCVSSWTRIAPNTLPAMAKSGANYMNSQLIKMEAIVNGFVEGIALDVNGFVSEGSGENVF